MHKVLPDKHVTELRRTLSTIKSYFSYAALFSAAVNVLMLVPIIYMLQVYDRVVSSGSLPTLMTLTIIMMFLLFTLGGFEWVRARILISASNRLEKSLRSRVVNATFKRTLLAGESKNSIQPVSDLTGLRQFLTGNGLFAFFDAPWYPVYVVIMFLFHPWFGIAGIIAGIIMVTLAIANEKFTNQTLKKANVEAGQVNTSLLGSLRNAEVIEAMGMSEDIQGRLETGNNHVLAIQSDASLKGAAFSSITRVIRITTQSLLLGLGALLVLRQEISPGVMIAGSLLLGRALAPIDMMVATWKNFSLARAQYQRLEKLLDEIPEDEERMPLPPPAGKLVVEKLVLIPPGARQPVVKGASFQLEAGESLGIVGPSAAGKSSLIRAVLGIWSPAQGSVRLDGADVSSWDRTELGPWLGYLPQDIELFDGTVADNISRFGNPDPGKIVVAARQAGVHEMILALPDGYDTVIGGTGGILSGGQRQRIGLARALYGTPRLLVLDEPNSNLDDQGEQALIESIQQMKTMGTTVIVVTHRTSVLFGLDKILVMNAGSVVNFDTSKKILGNLVPKKASTMGKPSAA